MKSIKGKLAVWGFLLSIIGIMIASPHLVSYGESEDTIKSGIKVSVVVPVYNTEKYIDECLESLENQTLKEIEIICVNDGSKDGSLQLLQKHAEKDSRIKVLSQENSGVSVARNNGLKAATGEYIVFFDSDDIFPPYVLEKEYKNAIKYKVNVVAFNMKRFTDGQETIDINSLKYDPSKVRFCSRQENQNPFYYMLEDGGYVITKLFKRSFLLEHNVSFKPGVTNYEDGLFNFMVFPHVTEMVQDCNICYCYRAFRPNSASTVFNVKKVLGSTITVTRELLDNMNIFNFDDAEEWVFSKIISLNYNHIMKDISNPEEKKYYASKLVEMLDNYIENHNPQIPQWVKNNIEDLRKISKE